MPKKVEIDELQSAENYTTKKLYEGENERFVQFHFSLHVFIIVHVKIRLQDLSLQQSLFSYNK